MECALILSSASLSVFKLFAFRKGPIINAGIRIAEPDAVFWARALGIVGIARRLDAGSETQEDFGNPHASANGTIAVF